MKDEEEKEDDASPVRWLCVNSSSSAHVKSGYFLGTPPSRPTSNSFAGRTTLSACGHTKKANDRRLLSLFTTARWRQLLYLPFVKACTNFKARSRLHVQVFTYHEGVAYVDDKGTGDGAHGPPFPFREHLQPGHLVLMQNGEGGGIAVRPRP
ncbi:hypothetical protein C4D60_Mb11t09850 [Musa balbisiana]|uniref:Uncharacterized protein n=1 Tax=Musa balbisiana TaxID=52838 RepID=A0A4S8J305_MUSBA|nr:hypothetical protein C4D60_Mb11t09850 [Musa balbisiana]